MRMVRKGLGTLIILLALGSIVLLGLPSGAHADQITFGPSTSGSFTFLGNGAGSVTVSTSGLSGNAFFSSTPSDLGTFTLGAASFSAGPQSGGLFPTSGTQSFSFTAADGDTLTGTITWNLIQDNTTQPKFFGTLSIATITGDKAFLSAFGASTALIDFLTTPLSSGGTLDALAATTNSATASISAGEVVPTPEPSSLVLFGIGLVVLCAYTRRKLETLDNLETGDLAA